MKYLLGMGVFLFCSSLVLATGGVDVEDGGAIVGTPDHIRPLIATLTPLKLGEIPGMSLLIQKYEQLTIEPTSKKFGIESFAPIQGHPYYRVNADFVTSVGGRELLTQYANLVHIPLEKIVLIHYLELGGSLRTFLLPAFFNLTSEVEAAAVLLSQAASSTARNEAEFQKLKDVTQTYFINPNDSKSYFNFYRGVLAPHSWDDLILPCLKYDQAHGAPIFRDRAMNQILFSNLLGPNFMACWQKHSVEKTLKNCTNQLAPNPSSLLAQGLTAFIQETNPDPTLWIQVPNSVTTKDFYFTLEYPFPLTFDILAGSNPVPVGYLTFENEGER